MVSGPSLVTRLYWIPIFERYGVDLRMDTKKAEVGLEAQIFFSILGSVVNIIEVPLWTIQKKGNLHFDNE